MITVTNDFKTAIRSATKQMKAYLYDSDADEYIRDDDDLISIKISAAGAICKSVMRMAEVKYVGSHDYLGKYVNLGIGVVLEDTSVEYIDYGKFKVTEVNTQKGSDVITLKLYDQMYEALQQYALEPTYPITVTELVGLICTELGFTPPASVPNGDDIDITEEIFTESKLSYRQIIDQIAEATGTMGYISTTGVLTFKEISKVALAETLTPSNLLSLTVGNKYGVINSVVLSRQPQEDNIAEQDAQSIIDNGLTEIKFSNNLIVDSDRETYITAIFNELNDLYYYPIESKTEALFYLEVGDRISVTDPNSNTYETVITEVTFTCGNGVSETLKSTTPPSSSTNYNYAGVIGQTIKQTEIIVDKQEGQITSIVSDVSGLTTSVSLNSAAITSVADRTTVNEADIETLNTDVSTLTQTADDLQVQISSMGGVNLLKNSVGLKGSTDEWGGAGTVVQTTEVSFNTESGSGIQINNEAITQSFSTIIGSTYTFYCRFVDKVQDDPIVPVTLTLYGEDYDLEGDLDVWTVYTKEFTATSDQTTITLTANADTTTILSDMVVKIGTCNGWEQAPNEVYGANFKFDTEGLTITEVDNNFKSVLDNEKLAVYDTSGGSDKVAMYVSKDAGMVTNFTAQDELIVRQYGEVGVEVAKSARFIPTDTGLMLVIND